MSNTIPLVPLDELLTLQPEKVVVNKDPNLPYIGLEQIAQGSPRLLGVLPSTASISTNCRFSKDDILFGKLRPNLRKSVKAPFDGYCSTDILVLCVRDKVSPAFAAQVMQWEPVFIAASSTAAGTKMPRTSWHELKNFRVFKPESEAEQSRIAHTLDTLDAAIAHTEAVIAKLQQVRAGLLHDLLTRGLDDNGELRDPHAHPEQFQESPLGRIPKAWEVAPLSRLYKTPIRDFGSFSMTNLIDFIESGVAFIKSEMIEEENLATDGMMYISSSVHEQLKKSWVYPGNVLYSKIGSALGKALIYDGRFGVCNSNAAVAKLDIDDRIALSQFVVTLLNSEETKSRITRSIVSLLPRLNLTDISNFELRLPPLAEQKLMVEAIQSLSGQIRIEKEQLAKLNLLKSGLMADLLTGRVRTPEDFALEH